MNATPETHVQKVVKFVQELLLEEADRSKIGPVLIAEHIELVVRMRPSWGKNLDRSAVIEELIRRFSMWIGRDGTLKSDAGHIAWLEAARKKDWRLWRRYREWLERDLPIDAIDALDRSTDGILGLLEDPRRDGDWDRRGLVVGHVQSGKTGNYTGLICKAADAGYKIIIVLAGLHNNLRAQTQMRLDEGFLGYATAPLVGDTAPIGVGEIDADPDLRPNYVTNRTNNGDFSNAIARNLGISPEQRPWLFVVKKNKTVLTRLLAWVRSHVADAKDQETGRKLVTRLPLLLLDDEADHASVDTGEQIFDEQGKPDEDHSPTEINKLIRRLLHTFTRSAYVGYTATPFANIFIHERGITRDEGPDLFPSAFIVNLAAPSTYVGPARIFGLRSTNGRDGGLPLVRVVADHQDAAGTGGWMPQGHKSSHSPPAVTPDRMPASLRTAILSFLLACAARTVRGQGSRHCSMLIHVTRFNAVQKEVHRQVADLMRGIMQRLQRRIDSARLLDDLRTLWVEDFVPATEAVRAGVEDPSIRPVSWEQVLDVLPDVVSDIDVRMINGTAKDALDYVDNAAKGLKVIAIGGDKLARGLTLEGLCTSYFLRASRMYDTLMQMGRWFGYRPGYLDLCRLYTTSDLVDWFGHIADASEELREEFDLMQASGGTPRDYGLKVQSHPVLMVTSRLKMRSAKTLMLSFSGQVVETVAFHRDPGVLRGNLKTLRNLVELIGAPSEGPRIERSRPSMKHEWEGSLWQDVPADRITAFLAAYKTHPDAHKTDARLLAEFIDSMSESGELVSWTVAILGGGNRRMINLGNGIAVKMPERSHRTFSADRFSIGRLLAPRDEAIDLDAAAWAAALELTRAAWKADSARNQSAEPETPNGIAIRRVRGFGADGVLPKSTSGLLLLYVLDPEKTGVEFPAEVEGIVGLGISFPGSRSGVKVEYKVNNVLWEQEYGSSE
jgi:hypothetical protein